MIKFQALSAEVQREASPDWTVPPMEQGLAVAVRVLAVVEQGLAEKAIFAQIEQEVSNEVSVAVDFALNAPYPAVEEVDQHVFA